MRCAPDRGRDLAPPWWGGVALALALLAGCGDDAGSEPMDAGAPLDAGSASDGGGGPVDAAADAGRADGGPRRALLHGWVYPGPPACSASAEYADGRALHVLKPEYFTVRADGTLRRLDADTDGCNAYSPANAADVRAHSTEQLVTVSAGHESTAALVTDATLRADAITTLTSFVDAESFEGVELDFEGFGAWSAADYAGYLTFVEELGDALHADGHRLAVDGPAIESAAAQERFEWRYEDFQTLPVDWVVVMAYDYQYDYGAGTAVAPTDWVEQVVSWTRERIDDPERLVIGVPAYGYHGVTGSYDIQIDTYDQSTAYEGFGTASRDEGSFEMHWEREGVSYFYVDAEGLGSKVAALEALGVRHLSIWHLGGNQWPER